MLDARPDRATGRRASRLTSWLIPPDFYPERVVDTQTWAEAIFEPVSLIGALICFVVGVVQLGLAIAPDWPAGFIAPLSALVSAEAFIYSRRLSRGTFLPKEWLVLLAPIVVLERALAYVDDPKSSVARDVATWSHDPLAFFSLAFVVDSAVLLLAWIVTFSCTQLLNQLRVQPGEIAPVGTGRLDDPFQDTWRVLDHSAPLRQLGQIFVTGGVVLAIVAALASIGTSQFLSFEALGEIIGLQRPSLHLVQVNVIAYFVFGLALLGECHFIRQRTLWRLDRIAMPRELANRWVTALGGLLAVALVACFILPTSYAMTLGDIISFATALVARLLLLIGGFIFYAIYLIMSLLPFFKGSSAPAPAAPPMRLPTTAAPPTAASPFDVLRSIIFWAIVLAVVGFSIYTAWRRRPAWLVVPRVGWGLRRLWDVLRGLIRLGRRAGERVAQAIAALPRRWLQSAEVTRPRLGFISLSRLGPAELVEYYYLSICERAAKVGRPRPPGATPAEYERSLSTNLPEVEPDFSALTDAFVESRYGPRATMRQDVERIKPNWQSLKQKLRGARLRRSR